MTRIPYIIIFSSKSPRLPWYWIFENIIFKIPNNGLSKIVNKFLSCRDKVGCFDCNYLLLMKCF